MTHANAKKAYRLFERWSGQGGKKVLPYKICQTIKVWLLQWMLGD